MVTQASRLRTFTRAALVFMAGLGCISAFSACDKMPLLAPGGTVITVFPAATTVPLNGEVEIVATVIENGTTATPPSTGTPTNGGTTTTTGSSTTGAGTPVQNGTLVSFTTTIGRIEPREARTQNGEVRVRFLAGGQSGLAIITAYSGGASGSPKDPLKVGTAAVERVIVTASPQTLGPAGGTATIQARVEDTTGQGLSGVPVNFVADAGQLSASTATTDQSGVASTTLTTARQTKVTANVGGKTADVTVGLNPRTGVTITGPTNSVPAGTPATFTVNVGTQANVRDVTVNFGDGRTQSLGAVSGSTTIPHTYSEAGTYVVTATAIEASGFQETVSTGVTVLPGQPPSVIVTPSNSNPSVGETVILTATVSGNTSTIIAYEWNFGTGATPASATTTGNRATAAWSSTGTKVITVRVIQASGPSGEGFGTVVVKP
jgi:Big-like domain-containing protein/PKD domain-containing protein